MPSAPSVSIAPFDAQTIGLTDWDNDITVGGLTYRATRFALGDATSSQDFSQGKGGFALGNQIDHIALENGLDGGGLLSSYVDSGAIPLNGAIAQLLDETGAATVQTWILCEMAVDGATLSFSLRTPGYMSTKLVRFPAATMLSSKNIGLVVGDHLVNGASESSRYKGVSVPTSAMDSAITLYRDRYPQNFGNPDSVKLNGYTKKSKADSVSSGVFEFLFTSQQKRDDFYSAYFTSSTKLRNSTVIITDGSNVETICWVDGSGNVSNYNGAIKNTTNNNAIDVPTYSGSLTDANSVYIAVVYPKTPICVGASSIIGFLSKNKDLQEYGIAPCVGLSIIDGVVLYFSPKWVIKDGFIAWIDVLGGKISWSDYSQQNRNFAAEGTGFFGDVANIVTDANKDTLKFEDAPPFEYVINAGPTSQTITLSVHFHTSLKDSDIPTDFNKIVLDYHSRITGTPRGSDNRFFWPRFFIATSEIVTSSGFDYKTSLFGKYVFSTETSERSFSSFDDLKNDIGLIQLFSPASDYSSSIYVGVYAICFYAVVNLALGQNPAVVVPGNFPGTSNPTTTPVMAATQLAAWLDLAPKLTGGITPSSGAWGEYIGASPDEDDTTYGKQRFGDLLEEAWIYGQEANSTAKAPDLEVPEYPVLPPASVDDLVTEPSWDYDYAGTSKQFTAAIKNVGESFDIAKGNGYFWGGWQEKDTAHFSTSPESAVLAMAQLEDCLAVVCADGYLRCSYDGGTTWPFSLNLGDTSDGMVMAGNGIMLAFSYLSGNVVVTRSIDAGRTWSTSSPTALAGATIPERWYDADSQRFWLCGSLPSDGSSLWYSSDGITWTHISAESSIGSRASRIAASGDLLVVSAAPDTWGIWVSINLGSTWVRTTALPQTGAIEPFLGRWDGAFRVAIGNTLYSSSDLSTWTNVSAPAALQAFATDGAVVTALASESAGGNHVYYSRDQGATWRAVQISLEGFTWASTGALAAIWDDKSKCFRFSGWGPTRLIALGDPSVLDIWHRCRASCLANSETIATATYKTPGLYDSSELLRWLLDCKDGTDSEYQQARIDWITKGARFVTLRGKYSSIVDQLSVAAGLPITIPRKILTYSGNAANIPTTGIVSKTTHHLSGDDKGLSEIEIIMPPL